MNSANDIGFHDVKVDTSLVGNILAELALRGITSFSAREPAQRGHLMEEVEGRGVWGRGQYTGRMGGEG